MNILGIIGWWVLKGIIAWAITALVMFVGLLVYSSWGKERWEAINKANDEISSAYKMSTGNKIICTIELILWPIGILHMVWVVVYLAVRSEEIHRNKA